jgi:23S rRNA pseudouridine1911/1915/1917 synthase
MEILYEDEDVLAVNKPAGMVMHSDGRTNEPSVSSWFIERYPEARNVGEKLGNIEKPGIVHRLDKDTSGAVLLAKTEGGYTSLKRQFKNREAEKTYHLFVYGLVKDDQGTINMPIGRSASDFRKRTTNRGVRGRVREALTYWRVLKRGRETTFLEVRPKTGRTHQIRVHMKAIHHSVVADRTYAPKKSNTLGFKRLALHARSLKFKNTEGKETLITAPYPDDFQKALENIGFKP